MKVQHWAILIVLLLAACQPQAATQTPVAATSNPASAASSTPGGETSTPEATPVGATPAPPPLHRSSSDPNAPNLIVVRDQQLVNGSVTIGSVTAAQPGWLVIYLSKKGTPGHQLGFVAVTAGKTQRLKVALDPNAGVALTEAVLGGKQLFAVLQAGPNAPGAPVDVGGHEVLVAFTILPKSSP